MKLTEIISQLKACAEAVNEIENTTAYNGPIIDAGVDIKLAIKHLERHARNEAEEGGAMKGIVKQFVFLCSNGVRYGNFSGNCMCCDSYKWTITADSKEEAIEKFKKCGGKVTDDGKIIMPTTFCDLAN